MDDNDLLCTLWQLMHGIFREVAPDLTDIGMSVREHLLLSRVEDLPHPAQLAEELFLPPSTITFLTKELEKRGLLERQTDPTDLRRFRFVQTEKGRQAVKEGRAVLRHALNRRTKRLSPTKAQQFSDMLLVLTDDEKE